MKEIAPNNLTGHRYRQLDSLRGIAALTVFICHFLGLKVNMPLYNRLYPLPLSVFFNGNAAVMFFFVLSGFVLSLPFVNRDKPLRLTPFYLKRVFRIYPALVFALLFSVVLKEFLFDKNGIAPFSDWIKGFWAWHWDRQTAVEILKTMLLIGPKFNKNFIDPPIWSLIVEVKMSAILPFFIFVVARSRLFINIILLGLVTWWFGWGDYWAVPIFFIGILIAKYKDCIIAKISKWPSVLITIVFLIAVFLYDNTYEFLGFYNHFSWPYKYVWSNYAIAIGGSFFMVVVLARKKAAHFFENRVFTFLGEISYSFYLVHLPVLITVASLFSRYNLATMTGIFITSMLGSVVLGYLMFIYIERPFQWRASNLIKKYKILNLF